MVRSGFLILFSAVLAWLCFPKLDWFWLWPVCLLPFFLYLYQQPSSRATLTAFYAFGVVFMGLNHLWFFSLTPFAPVYQLALLWGLASLFYGVFYGLMGLLFVGTGRNWLLLPLCWCVGEWMRGLGPFGNTNGSLGYLWAHVPTFLQWGSVWGVFGLSAMVVFVNVIVLHLVVHPDRNGHSGLLLGTLGVYFLGGWLLTPDLSKLDTLTVGVVQANHAQLDKLNAQKWTELRQDYLGLASSEKLAGAAVVFFPETITPGLNLQTPSFMQPLRKIAASTHRAYVFGTPIKDHTAYYNAVYALSPTSTPQVYRKVNLMPFGEYFPYPSVFRFLHLGALIPKSEFSPGKRHDVIQLDQATLGIGICLESIFPRFYASPVEQGATLLGVVVNNAWFGNSAAAYQHVLMTRLRAVEWHRTVVQAANTGISAVIYPDGRVAYASCLNTRDVFTAPAHLNQEKTFFARYSEFLMWGVWGILLLAMGMRVKWADFKRSSLPNANF